MNKAAINILKKRKNRWWDEREKGEQWKGWN
jgi:hypothetical protein